MKVISTIISASLLLGPVAGILGGKPVSPKGANKDRSLQQKRYTTGIREGIDSNNDFSCCDGVLISPFHVLTTATCVTQIHANFVSVGAISIDGGDDGDEIKVVSTTTHPHFNEENFSNNFAVLKLVKEVRKGIQPVKLPTRTGSEIQTGKMATVMGWGLTSAVSNNYSEVLLRLDQNLVSDEDCRVKFNWTAIDPTLVCAGGEKDKAPCDGDIGGPLIVENSKVDDDDVLIGLFVGGAELGCGTEGYPSLYSRVSSALDWITTTMKA